MTKTILLTLGRLPKALDLARGFTAAGCRVIIAEPFGWHLARVSRDVARSLRVPSPVADQAAYVTALAEIVETESADLIVPVSEEVLYVAGLKDLGIGPAKVFSQPSEKLLELHDKRRFAVLARSFGLSVPETARLGSTMASNIAQKSDVVVKPVNSCAGIGVRYVKRGSVLPVPDPKSPAIVQKKIEGRHLSTFTLARYGQCVATIVYEGTVFSGSVAVAFRRIADAPSIETWVSEFVERQGFEGFISFDFIVDDNGEAYAIECNPRVTSGIHFFDSLSLAKAILEPDAGHKLKIRAEDRLQQVFPCLTETQGSMFGNGPFRQNLHYLVNSRDVTWQVRDPLPLLLMTFTSYEILRRSIFQGMTFGEAATADIAWIEPDEELQSAS